MKRKKYHRNKLTQSDDYNPFDEIWFWLHLASISIEYTDFKCSQDKHDVMQNRRKLPFFQREMYFFPYFDKRR
jgi:hypothetical protein